MVIPDKRKIIINGLFDKYQIDHNKMKKLARSMSMGYMSKEDIRFWNAHGIDFGIHTVTHPCLTILNESDIYEEISASKKALETILEKPVNVFAYPYGKRGDCNELTKSQIKKAGMTIGMIFEPGINTPDTDFLKLYRMGVGMNMDFRLACHGLTRYTDIL